MEHGSGVDRSGSKHEDEAKMQILSKKSLKRRITRYVSRRISGARNFFASLKSRSATKEKKFQSSTKRKFANIGLWNKRRTVKIRDSIELIIKQNDENEASIPEIETWRKTPSASYIYDSSEEINFSLDHVSNGGDDDNNNFETNFDRQHSPEEFDYDISDDDDYCCLQTISSLDSYQFSSESTSTNCFCSSQQDCVQFFDISSKITRSKSQPTLMSLPISAGVYNPFRRRSHRRYSTGNISSESMYRNDFDQFLRNLQSSSRVAQFSDNLAKNIIQATFNSFTVSITNNRLNENLRLHCAFSAPQIDEEQERSKNRLEANDCGESEKLNEINDRMDKLSIITEIEEEED